MPCHGDRLGGSVRTVHPAAKVLVERGGVARGCELRAAGLSRRRLSAAVAKGDVRRLAPDVFGLRAPCDREELRTALAVLGGVASHEDAAIAWGLDLVEPGGGVHVAVPRDHARRAHPGVTVHRTRLRPDEITQVGGIWVTGLVRTLFDLARSLPVDQAVAVVDSALRKRRVTVEALVGALRALPPGRGRPRISRVLALVDPLSGSVLESLFRVLVVLAGLAPPESQLHIRSRGRLIGRVDFAWQEARLVVETDGFAFHADRRAYRADRRRGNALVLAGWRVLRFSWEDVVHRPDVVVAQVRAALHA